MIRQLLPVFLALISLFACSEGIVPEDMASETECDFEVDIPPSCGDNVVDPGELCDGIALDDTDCTTLGLENGQLRCAVNCLGYDISECS